MRRALMLPVLHLHSRCLLLLLLLFLLLCPLILLQL
jgi:hypothetical protein